MNNVSIKLIHCTFTEQYRGSRGVATNLVWLYKLLVNIGDNTESSVQCRGHCRVSGMTYLTLQVGSTIEIFYTRYTLYWRPPGADPLILR